MKVSTFKKELSATGKQGTVKAEVIATMNCGTKKITGTHAGTQRINSFKSAGLIHPTQCRKLNNVEFCLGGSYPLDYDFSAGNGNANFTGYLIGMSVPPLMTAHIASEVFSQWLAKLG